MLASKDTFPGFPGRTWRPDAKVGNDLESNFVAVRVDSPHPMSQGHGTFPTLHRPLAGRPTTQHPRGRQFIVTAESAGVALKPCSQSS